MIEERNNTDVKLREDAKTLYGPDYYKNFSDEIVDQARYEWGQENENCDKKCSKSHFLKSSSTEFIEYPEIKEPTLEAFIHTKLPRDDLER